MSALAIEIKKISLKYISKEFVVTSHMKIDIEIFHCFANIVTG